MVYHRYWALFIFKYRKLYELYICIYVFVCKSAGGREVGRERERERERENIVCECVCVCLCVCVSWGIYNARKPSVCTCACASMYVCVNELCIVYFDLVFENILIYLGTTILFLLIALSYLLPFFKSFFLLVFPFLFVHLNISFTEISFRCYLSS